MPDYIVIEGVKPYDGRYELDFELTVREWGWMKRHAGYLPLTFEEGFRGTDPELFSVLALIAMHRAGKISARDIPDLFDRLADTEPFSTIRFETDRAADQEAEEAGDADPSASSNGNEPTSGPDLATRSGRSEPTPSRTGTAALVSSELVPPGSGS